MSGSKNTDNQGRPGWLPALPLCLAAALLGPALVVFGPLAHSDLAWLSWPADWRYADSAGPMLRTADGYFFLSEAAAARQNGPTLETPALSLLILPLSGLLSRPLEETAFYLPLLFSLGLGLTTMLWGRRLKAPAAATALAALAAAFIPAWSERVGPGLFDTDMAIALFWQLEMLGLTGALQKGLQPLQRGLRAGGALAAWALLAWFWKPGFFLGLATVAAWAFFCLPARPFWNFKTRAALALGLAAWGALILFLPPEKAPAPTALADYASDLFRLAFTLKPDIFYSGIGELRALSPEQWLAKLGGTAGGGVLMLAAAAALFLAAPPARLPLALGLACAAAGLRSERFVYLGGFALALGWGLLPHTLPRLADRYRPRLSASARPLAWLAAGGLMLSCGHWALNQPLEPRWTGPHDRLALELRQAAGPGTRLWNWWDDGYFLAARTGLPPLFHGGSQTPTMAFIAARPLLMEDRRAAARWIRFFAIRGQAGLDPLIQAWGEEAAWDRLEALLSLDDPGREAAAEVRRLPGGAGWLLPRGRVLWYLPRNFTNLSSWWTALGASRRPDPALVVRHIEAVAREDFAFNPQTRELYLAQSLQDRGYRQFAAVLDTSLNPLRPPWPNGAPNIVFSPENNYYVYIVDSWGIKSLPIALLAPGGAELKNFTPLTLDYAWGGVWEVLP